MEVASLAAEKSKKWKAKETEKTRSLNPCKRQIPGNFVGIIVAPGFKGA